ncbi:MAG: PaaI family thioesterase [bacterium]|nr:PaaI family thioesterase [bacterium]MDT8365542.1 PaaI family thioesterase [bacterium]
MDPDAPLPFDFNGWVELAPFEQTLGMKIESSGDGKATLTMPFTVKLAQGKGLLHGGAITALADTAAAMGIKTLLPYSQLPIQDFLIIPSLHSLLPHPNSKVLRPLHPALPRGPAPLI